MNNEKYARLIVVVKLGYAFSVLVSIAAIIAAFSLLGMTPAAILCVIVGIAIGVSLYIAFGTVEVLVDIERNTRALRNVPEAKLVEPNANQSAVFDHTSRRY